MMLNRLCQSGWIGSMPWTLILVAAFVFIAPNVDLNIDLQWHDGQRLAQLALLLIVVLLICIRRTSGSITFGVWSRLPNWVRIALFLAFATGFISSLNAPEVRWALIDWGVSWLLVVLTLGVAADFRLAGEHIDQKLVLLFFATATAYSTSAGVVYVTMLMISPLYGQVLDLRELYVGFSNIRFFGHLQTMLLPFLFFPAMWWGTTRVRFFVLLAVPLIWWMLMIGGGTRGTWGGVFVGIATVACFGGIVGRRWIRWQLTGFVGGIGCYLLFILLVPDLLQLQTMHLHRNGEIMTLSLRDILWSKALTAAATNPWLGIAPMHFAYFSTDIGAHPHNIVLQWVSEWGIPAGTLLAGVCVTGAIAYVRHVRDAGAVAECRRAMIRVALLAALAGAGAQAMVDGVFVMPVSQTTLALLAGWAISLVVDAKTASKTSIFERSAFAVLILTSAATVSFGVIPEIGRLPDRERAYLAAKPEGTWLMPRFWAQGYIDR